ncbi:MAG: thioesterase family protein [Actinobacteria bacterium]|nr:thioesterase family protein [Actinomycetota bacterium]
MPFEFDEATSLTALGDGRYATPIHDRWDINGNANGGYLLALVANAMRAESGRAHPVSVTMHYLSPGPAGDGVTRTSVMKSGKRFVTVAGTLAQDGRDIATALGVFGDIDSSVPPHSVTMDRIDIPPFEECPPRAAPPVPEGSPPMGLSSRLDMRIHPDDTGFARGEPTGTALCRGYFSFRDGRPVDTLSLLLAADAFPPVMFNRFGMLGWVPTVEFTVHLRGVPAPGPIACAFSSRVIQGGMWEEDGEMWDSEGQVVALSRQLALAPKIS